MWQENEGISEVNQVRKIKKWGKHKWLKKRIIGSEIDK